MIVKVDKTLTGIEQHASTRETVKESLLQHQMRRTTATLSSSGSSLPSKSSKEEETNPVNPPPNYRRQKNIMTQELASALDRTQTSNREAVHLKTAAVSNLDQETHEHSLSHDCAIDEKSPKK